jgi:hypothetical protein
MSDGLSLLAFAGGAAITVLSLIGLGVMIDASLDWVKKHGFTKGKTEAIE